MRISDWSSDVCSSDLDGGCKGTHFGQGFVDGDGTRGDYGSSDFLDINGNNPYPDTVNLLVGHLPGSARAYPSFVIPYRGGVAGENPGTDYSQPLNRKNPGYIRGYERFDVYQLDRKSTRPNSSH